MEQFIVTLELGAEYDVDQLKEELQQLIETQLSEEAPVTACTIQEY